MNYIKLFFFIFLFTFLFQTISFGQTESNSDFFHKKRFNAGFIAGINLSELNGNDGVGSYYGINLGVIGIADLNNKMHFSLELLWSQNGEYIIPEFFPAIDYSKIKLNFIEIPFQFNYQLRQNEGNSNRFGWLRAGLAYAHLLDHKVYKENVDVSNQIIFGKKNAILVNFGGTFFLNQHWGVDVRMSFPTQVNDMVPNFSFRGIYLL